MYLWIYKETDGTIDFEILESEPIVDPAREVETLIFAKLEMTATILNSALESAGITPLAKRGAV